MADDLYTVADAVADALDLSTAEVSDLKQAAPFYTRMPAETSSNGTTHKYAKETGAPVVGFRSENAGRDFDHSIDTIVTASLKILDFSFATDKAVADAWRKGGREAFLAREGLRHLKAALYKAEEQAIQGTNADANGFAGLEDGAFVDVSGASMVLNGGASSGSDLSSAWLVRLGHDNVTGVVKGDGVVDLGETVVQDMTDGTGKHYPAYYTPACTWVGMQLGGQYDIARISNLDDGSNTLTDDKIYEAIAKFPASNRGGLVLVCSTRSVKQLRASRTATNQTGAPAPWPTTVAGSIPIIESDAVPNNDSVLAA